MKGTNCWIPRDAQGNLLMPDNMPQSSRLYYEAHITVAAKTPDKWPQFTAWAEANELRASKFDVDDVDQYHGAWFLSGRDTELNSIKERIGAAVQSLQKSGYMVMRWKIEDTVLDSKHGDTLLQEETPAL